MTDFDKNDLQKRLFQFAINAILLIRKLPKGKEYDCAGKYFFNSFSQKLKNPIFNKSFTYF